MKDLKNESKQKCADCDYQVCFTQAFAAGCFAAEL